MADQGTHQMYEAADVLSAEGFTDVVDPPETYPAVGIFCPW